MLSNYYTLRHLASSLGTILESSTIRELFTQERNELVVALEDRPDHLIFDCNTDAGTLYLHPTFKRARKNSVELFTVCHGEGIASISMHPSDRVIRLVLGSGHALIGRFFGAKSNVFLLDEKGKVIDSFKDARKHVGTTLNLVGKEMVYDVALLRDHLRETNASLGSALKAVFPLLGGTLVREILHRAQLASDVKGLELGPDVLLHLEDCIRSVLIELGSAQPRIYLKGNKGRESVEEFSILPLCHLVHGREKPFGDIHEAVREFLARTRAARSVDTGKERILLPLRQQVARARRTHAALEADLREGNRAEEYERMGTLLMSNLHLCSRGQTSVALSDAAGSLVIALDPGLQPSRNAQRYLEKAKRAQHAREEARQRLVAVASRAEAGERLLSLVEDTGSREELKALLADHAEEFAEFGIRTREGRTTQESPFRTFTVDGGFQVLAGKSSANNDLLTMKHARPNDLWFHARGASGSHVVLRVASGKGEPSKKAKEQAASIAAYYSRMKGASIVPVAMTERKHVRKPKGSPPGTVVLEREKVIFAEPGLPDTKKRNG